MARIPDEQVARLKTEVSIVRLVEAAGIELKKHGGSDRVGRCPFHDDRTPSLVVSPEEDKGSPISPALSIGKVRLWRFFSPVPVPSDRFATAARPAFLYIRMRVRDALQSPIEIKAESVVLDNAVVQPLASVMPQKQLGTGSPSIGVQFRIYG